MTDVLTDRVYGYGFDLAANSQGTPDLQAAASIIIRFSEFFPSSKKSPFSESGASHTDEPLYVPYADPAFLDALVGNVDESPPMRSQSRFLYAFHNRGYLTAALDKTPYENYPFMRSCLHNFDVDSDALELAGIVQSGNLAGSVHRLLQEKWSVILSGGQNPSVILPYFDLSPQKQEPLVTSYAIGDNTIVHALRRHSALEPLLQLPMYG